MRESIHTSIYQTSRATRVYEVICSCACKVLNRHMGRRDLTWDDDNMLVPGFPGTGRSLAPHNPSRLGWLNANNFIAPETR